MNIVTSYMRKWVRSDRGVKGKGKGYHNRRPYEYFRRLAFLHKDLIAKHVKTLEVEEAYALTCVRDMPLCENYDRVMKKCTLLPNLRYEERVDMADKTPRERRSSYHNTSYATQDSEQCLQCWTRALENISESMAEPQPKAAPAFLKPQKPVPSFLKKK